jgi:acyl-CoA thioester hydrolase
MADCDEQIGLRRPEHGFECLHGLAARLRRVEARAAAGEDDPALRQPPVADKRGNLPQSVGLGEDRRVGPVAVGQGRESSMRRMDGYRHVNRREVEFNDLDAAGHVNNATYLEYLETARIDYLRYVLGIDRLEDLTLVVARVEIDFRAPAHYGETLLIGARVPRVGAKSFDMEHEVRAGDGRLVAESSTVLVAFDPGRGETIPVPEGWRQRMETYEARSSVAT